MKIPSYLSDRDFRYAVFLLKKIATYNSARREWFPSRSKLHRLPKQKIAEIVLELNRLGVQETSEVWELLNEIKTKPIDFDGNYVYIRFDDEKQFAYYCDLAEEKLAYEIRKWDPEAGGYYREKIRRYWVNEETYTIKTFRGLLPRIPEAYAEAHYYNIQCKDIEYLRPYQKEALQHILEQFKHCGAATLQAAAGAGKTEIAVATYQALNCPKTFFLSLNTDLLIQAKHRFEKYGFQAGLVTSEYFEIDKNVVCCTVQTLYKCISQLQKAKYNRYQIDSEIKSLLEEHQVRDPVKLVRVFKKTKLVIFDEVQHVPANTVWTTLSYHQHCLRLGLSATPWRDDQRDLDIYALCGEPVKRKITSSELIEKGFLVPATIFMVRYPHQLIGDYTWNQVVKKVLYDENRMQLIVKLLRNLPKPFMILVREIRQGRKLNVKLRAAGYKTYFVSSRVSPSQRNEVFEKIRKHEIDGIVATTLADEGLDLPALRTLILAGGGKSSTRALQRVGRVIRPYPGKNKGIVVDIWDIAPFFLEHGEKRLQIYRTEPRWKIKIVDVKGV